jgi:uroporphyrinogen-III synthase
MTVARTVLVTRPAPDGEIFARRIEARGHRAVVEPLLDIHFIEDAGFSLDGIDALAFTSANGVRALMHACPDAPARVVPAFCVGKATATAARDAGFASIVAAGGDVAGLAATIIKAAPGTVLHVAGRERAGDLAGLLAEGGVRARRSVLYGADVHARFSPATAKALPAGEIDDVAILSPRTARQFVTLIRQAGLEQAVAGMRLLALSTRVVEAADLNFAAKLVARVPEQDALLDLIDGNS